jgi:4'-phosphopantetheinyl transferase
MSVALSLFGLDRGPDELALLHDLLDPEERARARQFRNPRDASRFVARRGQMRLLLAAATGRAPGSIRIARTPAGKPHVEDAPRFSLSHAGPVALLALSDTAEVGCDIERRNPDLADRGVAARFFAPAECRALDALVGEAWVEGFFNCWTRKEAVVKALGLGLSYPLDSFEVTLLPGEPAALRTSIGAHRLHAFAPSPELHVALCVASAASVTAPRWIDPLAGALQAAA